MARDNTIFVLASFVAACSAKVARLPEPGETLSAESFLLEPGGKGLNVAVGARRLGAAVDGLIAVGSDHFGTLASDVLAREALPAAMLVPVEGATGSGIGLIDAHGENVIAVYPGANALLAAAHVEDAGARIDAARLVIAQYEIGDAPIAAAFARARAAGATTILNPSPYRAIDAAILSCADVVVVNATEAARLAADLGVTADPAALAVRLADDGVHTLVLTRGAAGATMRRGGDTVHAAAFPVEAVDTIGAGDAFLAGFAAALAHGRDWGEALRWASACGAVIVGVPGVLEALPTRAAVEEMVAGT